MSIEFNGSSDKAYLPASNNFQYAGDFSINIWFTVADVTNSPYLHDYNGINNVMAIAVNSSYQLVSLVTATWVGPGGTVTLNKWHMATLIRASNVLYLYLDGVQVGTAAKTGTLGSNSIGPIFGTGGTSASNWLNGKLGLYEIYKDKALSLAEIKEKFYSNGNDVIVDNLVFKALFFEKPDGSNPGVNEPLDFSLNKHLITITTASIYRMAPFKLIKF